MRLSGWGRTSAAVLSAALIACAAGCPFFAETLELVGPGGNVVLRVENQSGLPVVVTARYVINDNDVRETVRRLAAEGPEANAEALPTRTRVLTVVAVVSQAVFSLDSALVQPGTVLAQGEFVWQEDFAEGETVVFVIPRPGPPAEPPGPGQLDCNSNGILDGEDISEGTSQDCNINGVPDECDSPPDAVDNPDPMDGATDIPLDVVLSWNTAARLRATLESPVYTVVENVTPRGGEPSASLSEFYSAVGRVFLSVDGGGSNSTSHTIEVQKPSALATVRKAFVLAASAGFSGRQLVDGDVRITPPDAGVTWSDSVPSAISSFNHLADVTTLLAPIIDGAPAGRMAFSFSEVGPTSIDGEVLAVVFNDPAQPADRTVILLFGAQALAGDDFGITLAEPINPESAGAVAVMSLGISFGFQPTNQVSLVDVNSQRLTSSAGGQDDGPPGCSGLDGELVTVGGLDDDIDNPVDPMGGAADCRTDDELYSLLPFITSADTQIAVHTGNPSNDDNIFFGAFGLSGAAVLGEGIVLGPTGATNPVGTEHTVTATVTNEQGQPVAERTVTFSVIAGPNQGVSGTVDTNGSGQASFTYSDAGGPGIDQIQASFVDSQEQTRLSNIVTKEWVVTCPLTFDVLFGTSSPPNTPICSDIAETFCQPPTLAPQTTYFWQVVADDGTHVVPGRVWSFTTGVGD
ncbi:MAG TPA: Ig-like domain-containing protein [Phycisphaerae bacterium]|nr:Ig-like domain-containing protein [Phycisphaerae bacterium]